MAVDVESDPFFQQLTDALRAGPDSPEWQEAVARLRAQGGAPAGADEYRLLITAREHLGSGQDYRTVRAGAGFTRKLFDSIEDERKGGGRPGVPMANVIALVSALAILVVLGVVAFVLSRGPREGPGPDVDRLAATFFPNTVASATFQDGGGGAQWMPGESAWRWIGRLPVAADPSPPGYLRPGKLAADAGNADGGGLVLAQGMPPDQPFAVEAEVVLPGDSDPVIVEVFVSDSADFSTDRATAPRELVWLAEPGTQRVVVEGRVQELEKKTRPASRDPAARSNPIPVTIIVDRDVAVVKAGDQRLWAGPHGLAPDRPRYAGVRFIRRRGDGASTAAVSSVRVMSRAAAAAPGGGG